MKILLWARKSTIAVLFCLLTVIFMPGIREQALGMICEKCGKDGSESQNFCIYCGEPSPRTVNDISDTVMKKGFYNFSAGISRCNAELYYLEETVRYIGSSSPFDIYDYRLTQKSVPGPMTFAALSYKNDMRLWGGLCGSLEFGINLPLNSISYTYKLDAFPDTGLFTGEVSPFSYEYDNGYNLTHNMYFKVYSIPVFCGLRYELADSSRLTLNAGLAGGYVIYNQSVETVIEREYLAATIAPGIEYQAGEKQVMTELNTSINSAAVPAVKGGLELKVRLLEGVFFGLRADIVYHKELKLGGVGNFYEGRDSRLKTEFGDIFFPAEIKEYFKIDKTEYFLSGKLVMEY